jgi:pyruvate-ferredoxin/flavodoxin oxidoreductase
MNACDATMELTLNAKSVMMDGNEAVASIAYQTNEVVAIYPITPSSPMGEWADQWVTEGRRNSWGAVPLVIEMQSEGGAAGAIHGALQTGCLTTTFTASQGLLLMVPNMYKIAGELTSAVIHVAARSLATQGLSIFGDHSDVMAARSTGWAMLASGNVQEAADFALLAQAATLEARIPFLHFFDGFRTSHEIARIELPTADVIRQMIDDELVRAHRLRALSPERPVVRGTSQNADVYFQGRESANPFYRACPTIVQNAMDKFAQLAGRRYHLCDYFGVPDAERVIVLMGSGAEAAQETVEHLIARGERVGLLRVRLFRPFPVEQFLAAIPQSTQVLVALDRTKEPGSTGEPLYLDVVAAMNENLGGNRPRVVGGRYGLGSKEFTPAMIKGVFDEAAKTLPKNHFTVGIVDDVTNTSLEFDPDFFTEDDETVRAVFFGLGSDGTVGANKNSIKIIGEETDRFAQGYFVYDSKKAGSVTVSHLRFGPKPIRSTYQISRATFVACHQMSFLDRLDVLGCAQQGAIFLLNCPSAPGEVWDHLPRPVQQQILEKRLRLFVIDADRVAKDAGMGRRINTVLQTCFFALSNVLPRDQAISAIKQAIQKTYSKRGEEVVQRNNAAVDSALDHLHEVNTLCELTSTTALRKAVPDTAPEFVRKVTAEMIGGRGDYLPVSALPADGTYPVGTSKWEKRGIAQEVPVWDEKVCIQCGKCVLVCPHGVIRAKVCEPAALGEAPESFRWAAAKWQDRREQQYTLQVAAEDCTGCGLCVEVCPAKNKSETRLKAINMRPFEPLRESQRTNWDYFLRLAETDRQSLRFEHVKDVQLLEPLFEFSGACAGCGETPYLKLITQLFGDRMLVANATGCSSIYGGNLPTTPWTTNREGRGPAWSNSLFEDNAEFGMGMRLALDQQNAFARELLKELETPVGEELSRQILAADQSTEEEIVAQRERVALLKKRLQAIQAPQTRQLDAIADSLVKKSVWIVGGDGWAYDIGFGGLDHVLASGRNVNVLVLDTEVYSNTGGQMSKATPRGAVAKFATGGKPSAKKDLAMMAMTYGNVYVARIAMGANDAQTIKTFLEAEAYDGPALIIAYSHCIAHGYDLVHGMEQQKAAVLSGHWPLMRFDPRKAAAGQNPLVLDCKAPAIPLSNYIYKEARYSMLRQSNPEVAQKLLELAAADVKARWQLYENWSQLHAQENSGEART